MHEEHADQATPDETKQSPRPIADKQPTQTRRDQEADQHPKRKQSADGAKTAAFEQVRNVLLERQFMVGKEPADMRVVNALEKPQPAVAVEVGRMRVALLVAFLVVMPMVGNPAQQRSLDCHATQNPEQGSDRAGRLEGAMGKEPMESDRDPQPGKGVHDQHDGQVGPAKQAAPAEPSGGNGADKRTNHKPKGRETNRKRDLGGGVLVWGGRGSNRRCVWNFRAFVRDDRVGMIEMIHSS